MPLFIGSQSGFLLIQLWMYCYSSSAGTHLNATIDYRVTKTPTSLDLTIADQSSAAHCPSRFLTLIDFISSSTMNITVRPEHITGLQLVRLCVSVEIGSIEKLVAIRRIAFENCTIHFAVSKQQEDYDFYPKNLSRWSFNQGRTETFQQFITMINHLGPFQFDLHLANCFKPILSFNDFIPLNTPLILLNITCSHFQVHEPAFDKTRMAIFLTPTLTISTPSNPCPPRDQYLWLSTKRTSATLYSLRTLTCEGRSIELNFAFNQTRSMSTTVEISVTYPTRLVTSTVTNRWPAPVVVRFTVVLLSGLMLCVALAVSLHRLVWQ